MKNVDSIAFRNGSKEELLPDFAPDFPYICSCALLDRYIGRFVPWHWHKEVELFYIQKGTLEYHTPQGKTVFPTGSGGLVNSNVLHMTKPQAGVRDTTQTEHIFDVSLIAGLPDSRIAQKYIMPLIAAQQIEILSLHPDNPLHTGLLQLLAASFQLSSHEPAYEIKLRAALSEIWCGLLELSQPLRQETAHSNKANDKIKLMMIFIHEHYGERLTTAELAAAAFISQRECFRAFGECLRMTPVAYLNVYRLQMACLRLAQGDESITDISLACGFGSSSYFGKLFRVHRGCTPLEYRNRCLAESS